MKIVPNDRKFFWLSYECALNKIEHLTCVLHTKMKYDVKTGIFFVVFMKMTSLP